MPRGHLPERYAKNMKNVDSENAHNGLVERKNWCRINGGGGAIRKGGFDIDINRVEKAERVWEQYEGYKKGQQDFFKNVEKNQLEYVKKLEENGRLEARSRSKKRKKSRKKSASKPRSKSPVFSPQISRKVEEIKIPFSPEKREKREKRNASEKKRGGGLPAKHRVYTEFEFKEVVKREAAEERKVEREVAAAREAVLQLPDYFAFKGGRPLELGRSKREKNSEEKSSSRRSSKDALEKEVKASSRAEEVNISSRGAAGESKSSSHGVGEEKRGQAADPTARKKRAQSAGGAGACKRHPAAVPAGADATQLYNEVLLKNRRRLGLSDDAGGGGECDHLARKNSREIETEKKSDDEEVPNFRHAAVRLRRSRSADASQSRWPARYAACEGAACEAAGVPVKRDENTAAAALRADVLDVNAACQPGDRGFFHAPESGYVREKEAAASECAQGAELLPCRAESEAPTRVAGRPPGDAVRVENNSRPPSVGSVGSRQKVYLVQNFAAPQVAANARVSGPPRAGPAAPAGKTEPPEDRQELAGELCPLAQRPHVRVVKIGRKTPAAVTPAEENDLEATWHEADLDFFGKKSPANGAASGPVARDAPVAESAAERRSRERSAGAASGRASPRVVSGRASPRVEVLRIGKRTPRKGPTPATEAVSSVSVEMMDQRERAGQAAKLAASAVRSRESPAEMHVVEAGSSREENASSSCTDSSLPPASLPGPSPADSSESGGDNRLPRSVLPASGAAGPANGQARIHVHGPHLDAAPAAANVTNLDPHYIAKQVDLAWLGSQNGPLSVIPERKTVSGGTGSPRPSSKSSSSRSSSTTSSSSEEGPTIPEHKAKREPPKSERARRWAERRDAYAARKKGPPTDEVHLYRGPKAQYKGPLGDIMNLQKSSDGKLLAGPHGKKNTGSTPKGTRPRNHRAEKLVDQLAPKQPPWQDVSVDKGPRADPPWVPPVVQRLGSRRAGEVGQRGRSRSRSAGPAGTTGRLFVPPVTPPNIDVVPVGKKKHNKEDAPGNGEKAASSENKHVGKAKRYDVVSNLWV